MLSSRHPLKGHDFSEEGNEKSTNHLLEIDFQRYWFDNRLLVGTTLFFSSINKINPSTSFSSFAEVGPRHMYECKILETSTLAKAYHSNL
jgi:hypothetical protein